VAKLGARWRVGSGVNIPILSAPWFKDGKCVSLDGPLAAPLADVNLSAFVNQFMKTWKVPLIYNLFDITTSHLILSTLSSHRCQMIS